ncbi:MAG: hypothetical protein H7210_14655 [Pyrinomonadaceae bacterium]|nr:hypothetical protein [Phycisphaerales bacterium]
MKSVQTMLVCMLMTCGPFLGCESKPELVAPRVLQSPYAAARSETLWALAPVSNESGVSKIDMLMMTDTVAAAVAEVSGISVLPVNRTLAAMVARNIPGVRSPRDAMALAEALGVQGIIVGTITAYDPYDPPKLGMTLALYTTDASASEPVDPRSLSGAYSDQKSDPNGQMIKQHDKPTAVVAEHLDAANHEVLAELKQFATGRHDQNSSLQWRRYTASMELYTQFAAYYCVDRLLRMERARTTPVAAAATEPEDEK